MTIADRRNEPVRPSQAEVFGVVFPKNRCINVRASVAAGGARLVIDYDLSERSSGHGSALVVGT